MISITDRTIMTRKNTVGKEVSGMTKKGESDKQTAPPTMIHVVIHARKGIYLQEAETLAFTRTWDEL